LKITSLATLFVLGLAACGGPERYALRYDPAAAQAPAASARGLRVFVDDVKDQSGGLKMTKTVLRTKTEQEHSELDIPASTEPELGTFLKAAFVTELRRLGVDVTAFRPGAARVLEVRVDRFGLEQYDESLVGGPLLVGQRATIALTASLTDAAGRALRTEELRGEAVVHRFGLVPVTREMALNQAAADLVPRIRTLFESPNPGSAAPVPPKDEGTAPAAVPWWAEPNK
jgi:uncharacterized lipoprotein YmbA